jgi:hypothetical protein
MMIDFVSDAKEFVRPLWELVQRVAREKSYIVYFSIDKVGSKYRILYSIDGKFQLRRDIRCDAPSLRPYAFVSLMKMLRSVMEDKPDVVLWITSLKRENRAKCTLNLLSDFMIDVYIPDIQSRKHRTLEIRRLSDRELLSEEEMDMGTFAKWIYGALLLALEAKQTVVE